MVNRNTVLKAAVVGPGLVALLLIIIGISTKGWLCVTSSKFTPNDNPASEWNVYQPIEHGLFADESAESAWKLLELDVGLYDYWYDVCGSSPCEPAIPYIKSGALYLKFPLDELYTERTLKPGRYLGPTGLVGVLLGLAWNAVFISNGFKKPKTLGLSIAQWIITAFVLSLMFGLHIWQSTTVDQVLYRYRLYFYDYLQISTTIPWSLVLMGIATVLCYLNPIIIGIVFYTERKSKPVDDKEGRKPETLASTELDVIRRSSGIEEVQS